MQLGFVSAILPDLSLQEVFETAAHIGYDCVELMCWPAGEAERRYAGVTHVEMDGFDDARAKHVRQLAVDSGVAISGLGYYPNPLSADFDEAGLASAHIRKVVAACDMLDRHGDDAHQLWGRGVFYVYPRACYTPTGLHLASRLQKRPAVRVLKGGRARLSAHAHLELGGFCW